MSDLPVAGNSPRNRFDPVRERVKELEWLLPVPLQRPLLRIFGQRHDPYSDRIHATRGIFIHIPRTGGSSIATAMGVSHFHYPVCRYSAFNPTAFRQYFKFGFVRNPWDRLLSAYAYLRAHIDKTRPFPNTLWARRHLSEFDDFERFVLALRDPSARRTIMRHIHFRPQLDWTSMPGSTRVELDFVGRFETLAEDFRKIAQRLDIDADLPVTNASSHGDYRNEYSTRMRAIAAELYREDIDAFSYEF